MHVTRLSLTDFRSYAEVELTLERGPVAFVGANGQGKTNLVEAVDYLSRLDSHRVSNDAPLVRAGAERAVVRAEVVKGDRTALVEVEITPGRSNRARVNRAELPRTRDLVGVVRTVMFSPEDLALVKGDPSERRRFLDALLVMRTPRLAGVKADYDRALRQRSALLKSARGRQVDLSTLDIWDEKLSALGGELVAQRLRLLDDLDPHLAERHAGVASSAAENRRSVSAVYRTSLVADDVTDELPRSTEQLTALMLERIAERRRDELDRGVTLVGPHRDDVVLGIGDLPAKGYASHGESWSLALALRFASFDLLRVDDDPVLVLDDVFAELDTGRREHLAAMAEQAEQVLVTAAVADDVPAALQGRRFRVQDGKVVDD